MKMITNTLLEEKISLKKEEYRKEISVFKEAGYKFLNDEISRGDFKAASGGMGVYAERNPKEFMVRLRILSGVLDLDTFKAVQKFAHKYAMEYIHFTTRQAIQLHNLQFDNLLEIMEDGLDYNIITRGGGGNFPRNVSLSPLAGVDSDEAFDVTPYALMVNKYFLSQINTYRLPRKFKVAFSSSQNDTANASIADLGFLAIQSEGKNYFKLYIGGSLGVNPEISVEYDELIPPAEVMYHIEALLSLFKEEGDYENKSKARMRFIVKRMGKDGFLACYKKHLNTVKSTQELTIDIQESFQQNELVEQNNTAESVSEYEQITASKDVILQKQFELYSVIIHPQGGNLKISDMDKIIEFMESNTNADMRMTMEESLIVRNLTVSQTKELLDLTKDIRKSTRLSKSVSCIGVPICQVGIQESQKLLNDILEYFEQKDFQEDILPSIHISGCLNSCSRHHANLIGFQGKKKRIDNESVDVFTLFLGGKTSGSDTHLGKEYGDIKADNIPEFLYKLAIQLQQENQEFEEYLNTNNQRVESLLSKYIV